MFQHPGGISQLLAIIDSAPVSMVMIDQEGYINFVNAEATRVFGYSREEFFRLTIEALLPERFRGHHADLRKVFFADHKSRQMGEGRNLFGLRKDGTEFPVEIGLRPVETSQETCVLSVILDITERKRLEAVRQQAAEALERTNQRLQQFAYFASHDLQTPLRTISGFVQLLQDNYEDKLDARAKGWIRRTVGGVRKMHAQITDMLAYARLDSTDTPLLPTDVRQAFEDAIDFLDGSIGATGAEVTCGELPTLRGDRSQLVQLIQNLVGNALKYHAHGGQPPRVHVEAVENGAEWLFSVRDNGIGIDPRHQEGIFELFKRLHTEQAYPGTGIGLAMCRRIAENHGGRIWVESEPGEGSIFYFTISKSKHNN